MSEEQESAGLDEFPPEVRDDVDGLLWLGYLDDDFEFCGHTFTICTMRGEDELLAALVSKDYVDSLGQHKAWTWANIAMCLFAVDGDEDFCPPIGPDKRQHARARFQYCTSNWYWPVAMAIYERYAALLERQNAAFEAIQSLSQRSPTISSALPDSFIEKADSEPPEILGLLDED